MSDQFVWTEERLKKRRQRAVAMAWLLAAFAVLLIFITIARIGGSIAERPEIGAAPSIEGGGR